MDLYILRHAIAEEKLGATEKADSERRLTPAGARRMSRIARGMKTLELEFDLIVSSPYVRARQTAEIVAKAFKRRHGMELSGELKPRGNPRLLLQSLNEGHGGCRSVLLVGHEPYLSSLISVLISGDTGLGINFKKGGLCKLTSDALKYGRCATLEWLLTPKQLRELG